MAHLDLNFDEAVEPKPLPKGKYPLQITAADQKKTGAQSKNPGSDMIVVTAGFTGPSDEEQNAPTVRHYISLPSEGDKPESARFKVLLLKRFMVAFGVPVPSGNVSIDVEQLCFDLIGRNSTLEVGLTEPNDNDETFNELKIPKMRDEAVTGRSKRG